MDTSKRAVVSGGAGFIGSTIVDALVAEGTAVLVLDDLSRGSAENLRAAGSAVELAEVDVRDGERVRQAITAFAPDTVFHLAAQIDVRVSMDRPAQDASVNVLGSVNVFAAALEAGARRVVNTSTGGAIYSRDAPVPTPESAPCEPLSAYGLSKRTVEEYARWFARAKGLDVVTLRYGNVYGPRQDPAGDAGVIAIFCDCALHGKQPVVFGDGRQTRDFVYVGDVAAANLAAARLADPPRRTYNVGTGREISVLELAAAVADAAEVEPERMRPHHAPPRAGEVQRSCLDVRLAVAELGLAEPTPLREGLRRTLDWMRGR